MRIADEHLEYWADRYVAAGLERALTFQRFLTLAVSAREQRIQSMQVLIHVPHGIDRAEDAPVLRGDCLVKPMHSRKPRHFRRPWFFRRKGHR